MLLVLRTAPEMRRAFRLSPGSRTRFRHLLRTLFATGNTTERKTLRGPSSVVHSRQTSQANPSRPPAPGSRPRQADRHKIPRKGAIANRENTGYHPRIMQSLAKFLLLFPLLTPVSCLFAQTKSPAQEADAVYPEVYKLYVDLHEHPELSGHEVQTATKLAAGLRDLGYEVTEHVGGTGIVGVLRNGSGPTVMLRTELDALPVEEKTGLPYASKVHTKDDAGQDVGVMHACGHDVHMASLLGTAEIMAQHKSDWHGTLMLVGQPAEETITGAKAMIADGFMTRFPKPDAAVALHVGNLLPAGKVGIVPGILDTNADSLRITIYGKGGHGSAPHTAVDPIVIAARTILSLQTIASREVKPGELAVVTVGYIHAGTKNNIIPDQAELGLTVRTYKEDVRKQVLAAIRRITKAEAEAAGAPREPLVDDYESTDSVFNDPQLALRLRASLE